MNHPDIFAFSANQADFGGPDLVVYAWASVSLRRRVVGSASYWFIPLIIAEFRARNLDWCADCFKQHKCRETRKSKDL
jgi:hypothetical protein